MRTRTTMTSIVYTVGSSSFGGATMAQAGSAGAAKNVVLVHGAFADDSSWSKVVPFPGELPETPVLPEALTTDEILVDGQIVNLIHVGQGEIDGSTISRAVCQRSCLR